MKFKIDKIVVFVDKNNTIHCKPDGNGIYETKDKAIIGKLTKKGYKEFKEEVKKGEKENGK